MVGMHRAAVDRVGVAHARAVDRLSTSPAFCIRSMIGRVRA